MRHLGFCAMLSLGLAACHWSRPAASAENTDESESSDDSASAKSTNSDALTASSDPVSSAPLPAKKATVVDDTDKKESPCSGSAIADLLTTLSQESCEVPEKAPPPKVRASKDVLDVKAMTDSSKVAPGGTTQVMVVYTNRGQEPLALDFTIDPDPRFQFQLFTTKGARADKPAGAEPALPSEVSDAPPTDTHVARVTLAPHGKATLVLPWQAVKYKWASKERAKGALPGRGYPREPAGPLARGKYVLHVVAPLADADEGGKHELSDASVPIEIAGSVQVAAPPPKPVAAPPPKKAAVAPAAPAQPEESIEEKFLKATHAKP